MSWADKAIDDMKASHEAEIAALRDRIDKLEKALEPFVASFERRRDAYSKRYQDQELGYVNFDKMPDEWAMEQIAFNMGAYRRASAALDQDKGRE